VRLLHLRMLLRHIARSLGLGLCLGLSLLSCCCLLHVLLVGLRLCVRCRVRHLHTIWSSGYPRTHRHWHRAWPTLNLLETVFDPKTSRLVGLLEAIGTSSLNTSMVSVAPTTAVVTTLHRYNTTFMQLWAAADVANRHMFNNDFDPHSFVLQTLSMDNGAVVSRVNTSFEGLRTIFNPGTGALLDSNFYFQSNGVGLYSISQTTGTWTSLNITVVPNCNGYQIGPNAIDAASQTYFTVLCPGPAPDCSLFQVSLSARKVVRSVKVSAMLYGTLWVPAS